MPVIVAEPLRDALLALLHLACVVHDAVIVTLAVSAQLTKPLKRFG
jgi:hypothetical protein